MNTYTIRIKNSKNELLAEQTGVDFVDLAYLSEYQEGDQIEIDLMTPNTFLHLQVDDVLGESLVYLTGTLHYQIPFGEKRVSYSPSAFSGSRHYLYVETASSDELTCHRNLAKNQNDQHGSVPCFPHAYANVETRGEAVFAARNAIDGVRANLSHGEWPYQSWGINRRDDAAITIDFGRTVLIDQIVLYTRADFPHDNWWKQVTFLFSDGTQLTQPLEKSHLPHTISFPSKKITELTMTDLIKTDDPSPFPALTQIEVYGTDILK